MLSFVLPHTPIDYELFGQLIKLIYIGGIIGAFGGMEECRLEVCSIKECRMDDYRMKEGMQDGGMRDGGMQDGG